jgi:hypothetical protein
MDCAGAQSIAVAEGQNVTGKDFQLDPGASISGTVYQSDGVTPLTGQQSIYVAAVPEPPCNSSHFSVISYTIVNTLSGAYTVTGLLPGTFYLWAMPLSGNYLYEWWASPVSTWRYCGAKGIEVVGLDNIVGKNFQLNLSDVILKGDINGDGNVDLADLIETLQILTGKNIEVMPGTDVNQNGRTGMEEAIYILQKISGIRP